MMNKRLRQVVAPLIPGTAFVASLFASEVFNAGVVFIAAATAVSVIISYVVWPSSIIVVALVMVVVATLLPISAMYLVANSGEESASIIEILRLVIWWKNAVPLAVAVTTAYFLRLAANRSRRSLA
jgi:hypothetical protein